MPQKIEFQGAYKQISLFSPASDQPIATHSSGPCELSGIFTGVPAETQNDKGQYVSVCAQPFYVGEVDHSIEEIGLMAVKEVRYIDEDQWEEMVKENQMFQQKLREVKMQEIIQKRKVYASKRQRNQKGQFLGTPKNKSKRQSAKGSKKKKISKKNIQKTKKSSKL